MLLGIDADLSAPPSSPTSYRDLTLFGKVFRHYDVLAICPLCEIDSYVVWFRQYGLFDFVDEILPLDQAGYLHVHVEGGPATRLTQLNLSKVIELL